MLSNDLWQCAQPMTDHLRYIPEWQPISHLWVGWPTLPEEWGDAFEPAKVEIAQFVRTASARVSVNVLAATPEAFADAKTMTGQHANTVIGPMGDIWLRDTGPIFLQGAGALQAQRFAFNGWGGRFILSGDTQVSQFIADQMNITSQGFEFILEGGSVDMDGSGRLLTTEECLLNPNRNPNWSRAQAEAALKTALGAQDVVWLKLGLENDHTDGHVDNLARFIRPGEVVCQSASGTDDPNADTYENIASTLRAAGLVVHRIPSPGRIEDGCGAVMPASHMNFVFVNDLVIMPVYDTELGEAARVMLADLMPDREVIALPARAILEGGGAFHCMTCQVPQNVIGDLQL